MESLIHPLILYTGLALGAVGVAFAMPRRTGAKPILGALFAAVAIGAIILSLAITSGSARANIFFYVFALISLGGSLRVITHPRPVYAALYFILTILSSAGLYLLLSAEFMTFALVIIYAGAILITYLFVIMLATQAPEEGDEDSILEYDATSRDPIAAVIVGFGLLAVFTGMMASGVGSLQAPSTMAQDEALLSLPGRVADAFDEAGFEGEYVELVPSVSWHEFRKRYVSINDGSTKDKSTYNPGLRVAQLQLLDYPRFRARYDAARARNAGESVDGDVKPLSDEAFTLIGKAQETLGIGMPLLMMTDRETGQGLVAVAFPEDLHAKNIETVGLALLSEHPLAIELAGIILLLALVGAVILARKQIEIGEAEQMEALRVLRRAA